MSWSVLADYFSILADHAVISAFWPWSVSAVQGLREGILCLSLVEIEDEKSSDVVWWGCQDACGYAVGPCSGRSRALKSMR